MKEELNTRFLCALETMKSFVNGSHLRYTLEQYNVKQFNEAMRIALNKFLDDIDYSDSTYPKYNNSKGTATSQGKYNIIPMSAKEINQAVGVTEEDKKIVRRVTKLIEKNKKHIVNPATYEELVKSLNLSKEEIKTSKDILKKLGYIK